MLSPGLLPITLSTLTAVSLAAFDGLAVTAAIPSIGGDLGHESLVSLLITAFALTQTVAALVAGAVIDTLGVRATWRVAIIWFVVTSAGCAVAPTMWTLIAARALQGIGGGFVVSVAISAIGVAYPEHLRSRAFAANSTVWGVLSFGGPLIAAGFIATIGWRAVFAVNLPLGLLAGVVGWNRLPGRLDDRGARIDRTGFVLLAVTTTGLLAAVTVAGRWSAPLLGAALVVGAATWRRTRAAADPVLSPEHLVRFPIGGLNWAVFCLFAGAIAVESFVPLYVEGGLGRSNALAAFSVAFMSFGWTTASIIVSRLLDHITEQMAIVAGFALVLPAQLVGALSYRASTPVLLVFVLSFVEGLGIGAATNASLTLLQKRSPTSQMGRANASHQFLRNLGSTMGVAGAGAILFGVVRARIGTTAPVRRLLEGKHVDVAGPTRAAVAAGFRTGHIAALGIGLVGLCIAVVTTRWVNRHPYLAPPEVLGTPAAVPSE